MYRFEESIYLRTNHTFSVLLFFSGIIEFLRFSGLYVKRKKMKNKRFVQR